MCGFVSYDKATIKDYPKWEAGLLDFTEPSFVDADNQTFSRVLVNWPSYSAYPAFGGDTRRRIPLLIKENEKWKQVSAIWWFDAFCAKQQQDGQVPDAFGQAAQSQNHGETILGRRTSFNARNLDSPFWKGSLNKYRGLVLATEIGESKPVGKTKHQYLMQSAKPFMLGAIYRKLNNGDYCCAIITRDAHPKMTPYHEKAFPLFLPIDAPFLDLWLSDQPANNPQIEALLNQPKLFPTLHVQRVKTYKHKQVIGNVSDTLWSDSLDN